MFGDSQIKYSITVSVKPPEKKCIVLIFLIKKDRSSNLSEHNFNVVLSEFS